MTLAPTSTYMSEWLTENHITPVRMLQEHSYSKEFKAEVWLARDTDGIFKVFKEIADYQILGGSYLNEDEILRRLPRFPWLPRLYGVHQVGSTLYMRRSYLPGQSLSDYCCGKEFLDLDAAKFVIVSIGKKLRDLLQNNLLFLDLRPENVLLTHNDVAFPDLGLSMFCGPEVDYRSDSVIVAHTKYAAPETFLRKQASEKSVVYLWGLIAYELLTGKHPYDGMPSDEPTNDWEASVTRYMLPKCTEGCAKDSRIYNDIIYSMLEEDALLRPSVQQCLDSLGEVTCPAQLRKSYPVPRMHQNAVLFPARMGVPHRGHIDYMTAILEMGYKLIISIQRSYTITDRDPYPKWLVMKMVAQSLMDRGFPKESFRFYLCPFYNTRQQLEMHFAMMPDKEHIVAVASNNSDVAEVFQDYPILCQKDVLGFEGELFSPRSWGEHIRGAIKDGDFKTFRDYAASGVEKIMPFEELQAQYGRPPIEFVPGRVIVELHDKEDRPLIIRTVTRYSHPEKVLAGFYADFYSKNLKVCTEIESVQIGAPEEASYIRTEFTDGNERIIYKLL